jgi:taurine dioxygenase
MQITDLSPAIGALVEGVHLADTDAATIASLRALILKRGVVFLHDQHLTPQQQVDLTARFGPLHAGRPSASGIPAGLSVLDSRDRLYGRVSRWHADLSSAQAPITFRVLQAIEAPGIGGDTLWASCEEAYAQLPPALQEMAEGLTAIHAFVPIRATEWGKDKLPFHWAEHPVVRVHPETGRKSLFVSPRYTTDVVGLRPHLSASVLKLFFDHLTQPEFAVRFSWRPGSVAIWDNRSTIHYAVDDYGDALRIMHISSVAGEAVIAAKAPPTAIAV